ncbi:hypothetical protein RAE19_18295 [Rhodoferax sp. TBRC 17660]|uniref:Lipoprotein n=1 Tax=Rhodoferax potami TaxID=3068338 RepID=A0ABU3KS86_9BURK|nr:hypothetical protein [Rhodoferax sp. TBRC 17660]MDT7520617.1 hypothetical protein [Rhodoferax sp. TBRC 17660]
MVNTLVICAVIFGLSACNFNSEESPQVGAAVEDVQLVLYFSDGDFDWKGVGDWVLINSGETLQIDRKKITPAQELVTDNWNDVFLPARKSPLLGKSEKMQLDRLNGIACLKEQCAFLYAVCPKHEQLARGEKCTTYSFKK